MILIVSSKDDYTADYLILELKSRKVDFVRLNTEDFPSSIDMTLFRSEASASGVLSIGANRVETYKIRSVWYRRPKPSVPAPVIQDEAAKNFIISESSAAIQGLWRTLDTFWVSHPDKIRTAESKVYQLALAQQIGLSIPPTLITTSADEARAFFECYSRDVIYKPLEHSRIYRDNQVGLIFTSLVNEQSSKQFQNVKFAPTLLQKRIPKRIEIRVTVVGKRVFATEIHSQAHLSAIVDWRRVDPRNLVHMPHALPTEIENKCVYLVQMLGLQFGALDFIVTPDDEYYFLEINPNGQWAWIQQLCPEVRIREALIDLLVDPQPTNDQGNKNQSYWTS